MIRRGTLEDLDALMGLVGEVVAAMREEGIDQWDEIYPDRQKLDADVKAGNLFVCAEGSGILAMMVLDENPHPTYAGVAWSIPARRPLVVHRLCVSPRFRKAGLARRLMALAESRAADAGHDAIRLDAFTLNPAALRLYDSLGYRRAGAVALRKGLFIVFEKGIAAS